MGGKGMCRERKEGGWVERGNWGSGPYEICVFYYNAARLMVSKQEVQ